MDKRKKSFVINTLRRASYRWPTRWAAEKRSKIARNEYYCECCGVIGPKRAFQMDHVDPVVDPIEGFVGFDKYIDRMYPDTEQGWQRLCSDCHDKKTEQENNTRKKKD